MLQHMSWVFLCFGQSISNFTSRCSLKRVEPSVSATLIPSHHGCGIISPHYSRHMEGQVPLNSVPTVFGKWLRLGSNIVLRPRQGTLHSTVWRALFNILYVLTSLWKLPRSAVPSAQNTECTFSNISKLRSPRTHSNTCVQPNPRLLLVWNPVFLSHLGNSLTFHPKHGVIKVLQEAPTCHYFCCPRASRGPTSRQVAWRATFLADWFGSFSRTQMIGLVN